MNKNEKRILTFASMSHFITHFYMLIFPVLILPLSRDLNMPLDKVIGMSFLMYLLYGLAAIPWGIVSDYTSPHLIMSIGIILSGGGLIFSGLFATQTTLPFTLALVGLGCAAYHPSGLALISKGIKERGKGLGVNGMFGNLGMAAAPFTAGILNYLFGWHVTLSLFGIVGILTGMVSFFVPFSVPRQGDLQEGVSVRGKDVLTLFLILCSVVIFSGLMYRTYTLVFPSWIEMKLKDFFTTLSQSISKGGSTLLQAKTDTLIASLITGAAYIIGMFGQLTGGRIADRADLRTAYLLFYLFALPFLLLALIAHGWLTLLFAGIFIFFAMGMQPVENSLYAMLTPSRWRSIGYGIKFTLTFGIGSLSVFIVKQVEPLRGLNGIILLAAAYLGMTIILASILRFVKRNDRIRHS